MMYWPEHSKYEEKDMLLFGIILYQYELGTTIQMGKQVWVLVELHWLIHGNIDSLQLSNVLLK
jgi:hypothetical protein